MELRHLRSFCIVAEEEHVTRAAKRLNIAQPALTQQIKSLEADLGLTLLHREGRGVKVTPAGRYLQKEGQQLLAQVRAICEKAKEIDGGGNRRLNVALSDVETVVFPVTDLLARYRRSNPQVVVHESVLEPHEIAASLRDGRIDAAFSCAAVPDRHDLKSYSLGKGAAMLGIPLEHPLATRSEIRLEELADCPLILLSHGERPGSFEVTLRRVCAQKNFTPHLMEVTPSMLVALSMVASAAGIAILPEDIAGIRTDAISYVPLVGSPELFVEFALYVRAKEFMKDVLLLRDLACAPQTAAE